MERHQPNGGNKSAMLEYCINFFAAARQILRKSEKDKLSKREVPRDVMQAVHHFAAGKRRSALSDLQLRDRLNQLEQLHILPEHRVQPDLTSDE
jgi:hypothetical protein